MVAAVISSIIAAILIAAGGFLWRVRRDIRLFPVTLHFRANVRVSMSALLRIQDDDAYVLFHTPYRPDSYGPPGGVIKYRPSARQALDRIGFREQRDGRRGGTMHLDLRGFVPAWHLFGFIRWFRSGADRETAEEALRRELREELQEVGQPQLTSQLDGLDFTRVRTVLDGPHRVPGESYRQMRLHHVFDMKIDAKAALDLFEALFAAGSTSNNGVIRVSGDEIRRGRSGSFFIGPQAEFLLGHRRTRQDVPTL